MSKFNPAKTDNIAWVKITSRNIDQANSSIRPFILREEYGRIHTIMLKFLSVMNLDTY